MDNRVVEYLYDLYEIYSLEYFREYVYVRIDTNLLRTQLQFHLSNQRRFPLYYNINRSRKSHN